MASMEDYEGVLTKKASFALNFLWLEKNIGVSVDQVFGEVMLNNNSTAATKLQKSNKCLGSCQQKV